jgi:hypothetical protein
MGTVMGGRTTEVLLETAGKAAGRGKAAVKCDLCNGSTFIQQPAGGGCQPPLKHERVHIFSCNSMKKSMKVVFGITGDASQCPDTQILREIAVDVIVNLVHALIVRFHAFHTGHIDPPE